MGFCMRLYLVGWFKKGLLSDKRDVDFILENNLEPSPMVLEGIFKIEKENEELRKQLLTKDGSIAYLEKFIQFCKMCHNPEDDCICG